MAKPSSRPHFSTFAGGAADDIARCRRSGYPARLLDAACARTPLGAGPPPPGATPNTACGRPAGLPHQAGQQDDPAGWRNTAEMANPSCSVRRSTPGPSGGFITLRSDHQAAPRRLWPARGGGGRRYFQRQAGSDGGHGAGRGPPTLTNPLDARGPASMPELASVAMGRAQWAGLPMTNSSRAPPRCIPSMPTDRDVMMGCRGGATRRDPGLVDLARLVIATTAFPAPRKRTSRLDLAKTLRHWVSAVTSCQPAHPRLSGLRVYRPRHGRWRRCVGQFWF